MELTHRERVRLALQHRETDRVPIAMVCSGIHAPVERSITAILQRERGITCAQTWSPFLISWA